MLVSALKNSNSSHSTSPMNSNYQCICDNYAALELPVHEAHLTS